MTTTGPASSRFPPTASRQQAAIRMLLSVSEGIRARIEAPLTERGVTLQQYNVLRVLADADGEGIATLAVADQLLERAPGITRLMDRLERQGLVVRTRGTDRRQVLCSLSDQGIELVRAVEPTVADARDATLSCLNSNEVGALIHFLNRIHSGLRPEVKE